MADAEIESFVKKFKLLRGAGMEASLKLETKLGEVFISINCKVGRDMPPPTLSPAAHVNPSKIRRSPSYFRRQVRRRAIREAHTIDVTSASSAAEEATAQVVAEEVAFQNCMKSAAVDDGTDINEETEEDTEKEDEETEVVAEIDQGMLYQKNSMEAIEPDICLSMELDSLIRQSEKNRDLWEKFGALPP